MSRYQKIFDCCKQQKRIAFIPFVMLGDPNLDLSLKIISQLIESGADALELGIPFSDPVADGPVIQASAGRALQNGVTPESALGLIKSVREINSDIPIGLLVYANLVVHNSIEAFYGQCKKAGVDSVLIADVPIRETLIFDQAAQKHDIAQVHILPPDASNKVLNKVAELSNGYTYILGRAGVTGVHSNPQIPSGNIIEQLAINNSAPPVLGFGVSKPEHVKQAKESGFSGVICGSAIVAIVEKHQSDANELMNQLKIFLSMMKEFAQ
ncbi:MAG: tryptophan synthase subunit alpha [Gammaproteobacteria bacterium]|jgi:tryptophan synthase alpha chain|nr:tryptophan synthase subunit alpha [Gammaproteobacteria bacterium]